MARVTASFHPWDVNVEKDERAGLLALEVTVHGHSSIVAGPVVRKSVVVGGCDGAEEREEEGRQGEIRGEGGPH